MRNEIKTEKVILDGMVREIYDYIEVGEEEIKHGLCKRYDCYGNLKEECFYEMGIKTGNAKEYRNGELKAEGIYRNGKKDGEWEIDDFCRRKTKAVFNDGVEEKTEDQENYIDSYISQNVRRYKRVGILFSIAMITITIACIFQINSFLKEDSLEKEKLQQGMQFFETYEEKEAKPILEFPKKYENQKEEMKEVTFDFPETYPETEEN